MNVDQQRHEGSAATGGPVTETPIGDQVMDILADVERQFERIREAQATRTREVTTLKERAAALEQRERSAEHEEARLREIERDLSERQADIEAHVARHEASRRELDAEAQRLADEQESIDRRLADLTERLEAIEAQRAELEQERSAFEDEQAQWQQRRAALEVEHDEQLAALQQREAELGAAHAEQLEAAEARLAALEQELAKARERTESIENEAMELVQEAETQRDAARDEVEALRVEHEALAARLEAAVAEHRALVQQRDASIERQAETAAALDAARQCRDVAEQRITDLEQQRDTMRDQLEERDGAIASQRAEIEDARGERDRVAAEIEAARTELAERDERIARHEAQAQELQTRLDDASSKLEIAGGKLAEFSAILAQQDTELEQAAALSALSQQQELQIERLTEQLAQAQIGSDPDAVSRKDQRIKDLTEALRQARGQTGTLIDVEALEQRNGELAEQNDAMRLEVERLKLEASGAKARLDEQIAAVAAQEQSKHRDTVQKRRQAEARLAELQTELDRAHAASAENERRAGDAADRAKTLERQLEEARSASGATGASGVSGERTTPSSDDPARERRYLERMEHLRRRRARLKRARKLLGRARDATAATSAATDLDIEERAAELRKLRQERVQLDEVRRMLCATEKKMIARWALPKAITIVAWSLILVGLNAGAAWLIADMLHVVPSTATVAIEAETAGDEAPSAAALEAWQTQCAELLEDPEFHDTLGRRMADRRLDMYAEGPAVRERLAGSLGVDVGVPGRLTLSLTGTNDEEALEVLDVVATTLATRSRQEAGLRGNAPYAVVRGERTENGQTRFASIRSTPVADTRVQKMIPIFLVMLVASFALLAFIYRRLSRAKRLFEGEAA